MLLDTRFRILLIMALYYKMQQILLENVTAILLQNVTEVYNKTRQIFYCKMDSFITKCDIYYEMRLLLQIATIHSYNKLSKELSHSKKVRLIFKTLMIANALNGV